MRKVLKVFAVLLFLGFLTYILQSPFFAIKRVTCKTQYGPCNKQDEEKLAWARGENFFFVNTGAIKSDLGKLFTNRKIYVEKVFPNTLIVSIEKRKAIVAVKNQGREGLFLVDADGQVIDRVPQSYLPGLQIEGEQLAVGQNLPPGLVSAVKTLYLTYKAQGAKEGQVKGDKLSLVLPEGPMVYYSLEREPSLLVGALQLILVRSRIEGKLPSTIDLRYSKPVLTYGQVESSSGN